MPDALATPTAAPNLDVILRRLTTCADPLVRVWADALLRGVVVVVAPAPEQHKPDTQEA